MMNRPILVILLGYLVGIIIGLYCKISIALFIIPVIIAYFILNFIKQKSKIQNKTLQKIKHYFNIFDIKKVIIISSITMIIANTIVLVLNNRYDNIFKKIEEAEYIATIVDFPKIKQNYYRYKIKIESIDEDKSKFKEIYLYLNLRQATILNIGDKIKFTGKFVEPEIQRNYGGFNYKNYLKSIGIYGSVNANQAKVLGTGKISKITLYASKVSSYINKLINENIENEDNKNLLLGILLGNDDNLENELKENFQNSSLSHILAVSGMHVSYVIVGISILFAKLKISKKTTKVCTILFLIFFIFLTGETPSVKRACSMTIMSILATFIYRKSDIITNMSTALLIILIQNPFSIMDIGLILSFSATLGIIIFFNKILEFLTNKHKFWKYYKDKSKYIKKLNLENIEISEIHTKSKQKYKRILENLSNKIKEIVSVSLSAQILIFLLSVLLFNRISLTFILSNILVSFIIGIIIILGFLAIIFPFKISFHILELLLEILKKVALIFANMPFSKIIVVTPSLVFVIVYYITIALIYYISFLRKKESKRKLEIRLLTNVDKFKLFILKHKKQFFILILSIIILTQVIKILPQNLRIHFIDVGQGDSSLIITPNNKTILIDGGGSASSNFDVREKYFASIFIR